MADELFTREEVLGGMPARRARTLLFVIEGRTAYLLDAVDTGHVLPLPDDEAVSQFRALCPIAETR